MAYRVEVLGAPFNADRQAALTRVLVNALGVAPETARLISSVTPCVVDGVETPTALDGLILKLRAGGFDPRLASPGSDGQRGSAPDQEDAPEDLLGADFRDYYKILGVARTADAATIKKAYRERSQQYHPDRFQNSPRLSFYVEMMKAVNEARDVLSDPARRAEHDREHARRSSAGGTTGESYSRGLRAQEEFDIALGFVDIGNLTAAVEALNKALFLDPDFLEAGLLLAAIYVEVEDFDRARAVAGRLRARPETRYDGLVTLAQCDVEDPDKGRIPDAIRLCDEAIALDPTRTDARQVRVAALIAGERPKEARLYLQHVVKEQGRHPNYLISLIWVNVVLNEFAVAAKYVDEVAPHLDDEVVQEIKSDVIERTKARSAEVNVNRKSDAVKDELGGGFQLGCAFWFFVVAGTVAPPHFIGVIVLVVGVVSKMIESNEKADADKRRSVKGVDTPSLSDTRMPTVAACRRCDFGKRQVNGDIVCDAMRARMLHTTSAYEENPCRGLLFINTLYDGVDGSPPVAPRPAPDPAARRASDASPSGTPGGTGEARTVSTEQVEPGWDLGGLVRSTWESARRLRPSDVKPIARRVAGSPKLLLAAVICVVVIVSLVASLFGGDGDEQETEETYAESAYVPPAGVNAPFEVFSTEGGDTSEYCSVRWITTVPLPLRSRPDPNSNTVGTVGAFERIEESNRVEAVTRVLRPGYATARRDVLVGEWSFDDPNREEPGFAPLLIPAGTRVETLTYEGEAYSTFRMNGVVYHGLSVPSEEWMNDEETRLNFDVSSYPQREVWVRLVPRAGRPSGWLNTGQSGIEESGLAGDGCDAPSDNSAAILARAGGAVSAEPRVEASPSMTDEASIRVIVSTVGYARVRAWPALTSKILGEFDNGAVADVERCDVTDDEGRPWCKVTVEGVQGWMGEINLPTGTPASF